MRFWLPLDLRARVGSNFVVRRLGLVDKDTGRLVTALMASALSLRPSGVVLVTDSTTAPPGGWIGSDGCTIGSGLSGAANRANADTLALHCVPLTALDNAALPIQTPAGLPTTRGVAFT